MREDELPQDPLTIRIGSIHRVRRALDIDRMKTERRIANRGASFKPRADGRDLQRIRLKAVSALLDELEDLHEGCDVQLPRFAWWYVASALRVRVSSLSFHITKAEREETYDEQKLEEYRVLMEQLSVIDAVIDGPAAGRGGERYRHLERTI